MKKIMFIGVLAMVVVLAGDVYAVSNESQKEQVNDVLTGIVKEGEVTYYWNGLFQFKEKDHSAMSNMMFQISVLEGTILKLSLGDVEGTGTIIVSFVSGVENRIASRFMVLADGLFVDYCILKMQKMADDVSRNKEELEKYILPKK